MRLRLNGLFGALRIVCAICLIAVSLWALLLPPMFPYSTHAIINTRVVTVRAGDPGRVGHLAAAKSVVLKAGGRVASITRDLSKIQRALEQREFTRRKLKEQLDSMDAAIAVQQQKLKKVAEGAALVLEQNRQAAEEKVRIYKESLAEKKTNQTRLEPLFTDGIITAAQWSEVREQVIDAEKNLMAAEADLTLVRARQDELHNGAGGVSQEADGMVARVGSDGQVLANLRIQRTGMSAALDEVENQIAADKSHRDSDRAYDLATPIDGIVWRNQRVNGENVAEGDPVVDVADAHAIFVEAYFRRDFLNSIAIGDRASVYLIGQARFITGRVVDIAEQQRSAADANIINTIAADATMLRVSIEIGKKDALTTDAIGRLARVLISDGKPGWFERSMVWLSLIMRSDQ